MVNDRCHGKQENQDKPYKAEETSLFVCKNFKLYGKNRAHFRGKVVFNVSLYKQSLKKNKWTFKR